MFDIFRLTDQLYQLRSTNLNGFKSRKIYFSKNLVANLLVQGEKTLIKNVWAFNKSMNRLSEGRKVIVDYLIGEVKA